MKVSVIIPALQWDDFLERSIGSVTAQELPPAFDVEIIVALARGSAPRSELVEKCRVVSNEAVLASSGLNRALELAAGEVVVRVDSRCVLPRTYIARLAKIVSDNPRVGLAGGAQVVADSGVMGSAYACAFNSPLLGWARYRCSSRSGTSDTVYLGVWRRTVLDEVGRFREWVDLNEDNELARRIQSAGYDVWYEGSLPVAYVSNRGALALVRRHYRFGRWRSWEGSAGQPGFSPRHLLHAAGAIGGGGALWAVISRVGRPWRAGALVGAYAALAALGRASAHGMRQGLEPGNTRSLHPVGVALAPALSAVLSTAWATGVLRGRIGESPAGAVDGVTDPAPSVRTPEEAMR